MPQRKIFLSYSHQDQELFDAFRTHLAPYEREGALLVWTDAKIRPAEDWDRKIHDMMDDADAAVVLVSPDALASAYVVEKEVPKLVAAAEAGFLLLTCLHLRPANTDVLTFDTGTGERVALTKYQGLNSPREPVAEHTGAARDGLLTECARKLWDLVGGCPDRREKRRTRHSRELTVELRRQDRRIHRGYWKPGWGALHQNHGEIDLPGLQTRARTPGNDARLGMELFEVVLGKDRQWTDVLPKAFDEKGTPIRYGVRLRIVTSDPELQELPWSSCHWNGYSLAQNGWTFELAQERDATPPVWLDAPCSALMVGANATDSELGIEGHWASFQALLNRAWKNPINPKLFRHAETPEALEERLREGPRLIYAYGLARRGDDGLELVLRDGQGRPRAVAFRHVVMALGKRPPAVVFLNTVGDAPLVPPIPGVPVVVHLRHPHASRRTRELAQSWWSDVLESGWDPVRAFHELGGEARRRGAIRTHYSTWETRLSDVTPKVDRPRSRLDRRVQREAVMSMVRTLATHRHRRVTAVIVYGTEGNLVEHFAVQVVDTLKDWARGLAHVQRHDLRFPSSREALSVEDFDEQFRDVLHLQPEQDLAAAFAAPRRGGPASVHVHFLNWGCYGEEPRHFPRLKASHLDAWLDFCCGPLASALTGPGRILSYVALALPVERHEALRKRFEGSRHPRWRRPHFEMHLIQPLKRITPDDLDDFLSDEDNTSCPSEYRHDIAERICAETGGEFEATVELLEEAEHGMMWPDLYHELARVERKVPDPEEDIDL